MEGYADVTLQMLLQLFKVVDGRVCRRYVTIAAVAC